MIYCVIPQALEQDLLDRLTAYYADDENVTVIVDRRRGERRGAGDDATQDDQRHTRDRRRPRVAGDFPPLEPR